MTQRPSPGRRRWLRGLLAAGLAYAARTPWPQALAMPSSAPSPTSPPPLPASVLHRRKGTVLINGVAAEIGAPVRPGDSVATGPDSEAVFVVGDDGFLLRADSQVTILERRSDPAAGVMRELNLESGRVLSVFGPKQISLRTPLASVGIRGTAAYLESAPAATNVCVCYGHAVMTPKDAPGLAEEVRNHHHETPRHIFPGASGMVMEEYRVADHSDDELIMLEALFGRVPPFARK